MKKLNYLAFLGILTSLVSCGDTKEVKEAKSQTIAFFAALKKTDTTSCYRLYSGFRELPAHYKTDSMQITGTEKEGNNIIVLVQNQFTNKLKKKFEQPIKLIFSVNNHIVKLYDSKGLCNFNNIDMYVFGIKTGCIDSLKQTTDMDRTKKIKEAEELFVFQAKALIEELKATVPISDLKWEDAYGLGMGSAKVTNNSPYPIYYLKYQYVLTNASGAAVKVDDGYISVDTIPQKGEKIFTFIATKENGASHLDMHVVYDKMYLMDMLKSKSWTGKEFANWKKSISN